MRLSIAVICLLVVSGALPAWVGPVSYTNQFQSRERLPFADLWLLQLRFFGSVSPVHGFFGRVGWQHIRSHRLSKLTVRLKNMAFLHAPTDRREAPPCSALPSPPDRKSTRLNSSHLGI